MTKETLQKYQALKREYEQLDAQLTRLESIMTAPKAQALTGMPRGGSREGSAIEDMVAKHVELQERYKAQLAALAAAQLEIEQAIETLDPMERRLMRYRYIDGMKWEEVCVAMSYSWRQTHRAHARALDKLKEVGS